MGEIELLSAIVAAIITSLITQGIFYFKVISELKERATRLETKIEPFWELIMKNIPDLLKMAKKSGNPNNPNPEDRKKELLDKLEKQALTPDEAKELRGILEREMQDAKARGDIASFLAFLLLLAVLLGLIAALGER